MVNQNEQSERIQGVLRKQAGFIVRLAGTLATRKYTVAITDASTGSVIKQVSRTGTGDDSVLALRVVDLEKTPKRYALALSIMNTDGSGLNTIQLGELFTLDPIESLEPPADANAPDNPARTGVVPLRDKLVEVMTAAGMTQAKQENFLGHLRKAITKRSTEQLTAQRVALEKQLADQIASLDDMADPDPDPATTPAT